jgi:CheY-like chemotaxis protein
MVERRKNTILLVSPDESLGRARKKLLEAEGLPVVVIRSPEQLVPACRTHRPRLILLGTSATPADKRRIWAAARELCQATLLELAPHGNAEISQTSFFAPAEPPTEFVRTVKQVLRMPR